MEGVMQVWLAAEVQLLSVSGFPSDIPIAANPLHRGVICAGAPWHCLRAGCAVRAQWLA